MVSAYAKKQDGLKVSWACLFTGLEMRKNMGQVKKTLKWIRKKSVFFTPNQPRGWNWGEIILGKGEFINFG